MNIELRSDFRDYYDHWFSASFQTPELVFMRNSFWGMSRSEMFYFFQKYGFATPTNGVVNQLVGRIEHKEKVVVYIDPYAHRSAGKILCSLQEALSVYSNFYASKFIAKCAGQSFRLLRIGSHYFWLSYKSDTWQSNNGNVEIKILDHQVDQSARPKFFPENPLLAIDYLLSDNVLLAIDLNISPGIKGTGIEKVFSSKKVFSEIEKFFTKGTHYGL